MKSLNTIKESIQPTLEAFENYRKEKLRLTKRGELVVIVATLLSLSAVVFAIVYDVIGLIVPLLIVGVSSVLMSIKYLIVPHQKSYQNQYREVILKALVHQLYPEVNYHPQDCVRRATVEDSSIFHKKWPVKIDFKGENYFSGNNKQGLPFEFSELQISDKNNSKDIFKGIFFSIETKGRAQNKVLVFPDKAELHLGRIGKKWQQSIGAYLKDAKMVYMQDSPAFEKAFVVYANSEADAHCILTPSTMQTLLSLEQKWLQGVSVSFIDNKLSVAISNSINYLEADIHLSVLSAPFLQSLYRSLTRYFAVLEALDNIKYLSQDKLSDMNWNNSAYEHFLDTDNT